jgi:hypothetical protein
MSPEIMSGAIGAITAAIISAGALLYASRRDKRTNRLLTDCRNALQDMVSLRDLEKAYAEGMSEHVEGTAEAIRLRFRREHVRDIGDYGQPRMIERLLKRIEDEMG